MKTLLASVALFAAAALAPSANAFPVQTGVSLTPQQVTFTVQNIWNLPVVCQGQFFAQTASSPYGIWLPFTIGPIVAGTYGYAYLTAPLALEGDYFIAVPQVAADCAYL
jgi:hypothetical protein